MTRVTLMLFAPGDGLDSAQRVARQRAQARIALARCAALAGAPPDGWRQDDNDRPIANAGFFWSIAHKRLCAVAAIANCPVGVDVECIKPRTSEHFDEVAAPREWAVLGGRSQRHFFRLWTAKEAVLKSTGVGMAGWDGCQVIRVIDDRRMTLTFDPSMPGSTVEVEHFEHADHIAAVTAHSRVEWTVLLILITLAVTLTLSSPSPTANATWLKASCRPLFQPSGVSYVRSDSTGAGASEGAKSARSIFTIVAVAPFSGTL